MTSHPSHGASRGRREFAVRCTLAASSLFTLCSLLPVPAAGQLRQGDRSFDVQLFRPALAPQDFLTLRGSALPQGLRISLGAYVVYMNSPLRTATDTGGRARFVDHQLGLELASALSLWGRLSVGLAIPVSILQSCRESGDPSVCLPTVSSLSEEMFEGGGFGDLRVGLRASIVRPESATSGFGLGAGLTASFPTADGPVFVGEGNRRDLDDAASEKVFRPTLTLWMAPDLRFNRFRVGLNMGYLLRRDGRFLALEIADQLLYGLGVAYRFSPTYEAVAEFSGRITPSATSERNSPHELLGAARFHFSSVRFDLGAGVGVLGDYGAPDFRLFAGLVFTFRPERADIDADGVVDERDECPREPEDRDGFADQDGCPELDNDQDGIPDALDRCPRRAGVTATGCPAADSDGDGIPDDRDRCPKEAEDADGTDDADGCPDKDNDGDGIDDSVDRCPKQPETFNEFQDGDGCPDRVPAVSQIVPERLSDRLLEITRSIRFVRGTSLLTATARRALNALAAKLTREPGWRRLRVEGHTDSRGSRMSNKKLSRRRADAVRRYLVAKGIEPHRLQAVGYGASRPIASNRTAQGRRRNRRVELIVVE